MANIKDMPFYTLPGNAGGIVFGPASNYLIRAGQAVAGSKGIRKSTDGGRTWTSKHVYSEQGWDSRLTFIDSRGYIFVGTISTTVSGTILRSTDDGENWSTVATSEASGWWRMAEDPTTGYLYASEYSIGNRDANELYAYNIWRSTDSGANWSKWYTAPTQTTPGAMDNARHTHGIYITSRGTKLVGWGDIPDFGGDLTGNTYVMTGTSSGALGTVVDNTANGFTAFVETGNNVCLFGGDAAPVKIYRFNEDTQSCSVALNITDEFGSHYSTAVLDMVLGDDGVVYAITNGSSTIPSVILASGDDGNTWSLIKYSNIPTTASCLTKGNGKIFIGRSQSNSINYLEIPDYTRDEILSNRVVVR